MTMNSLAQSQGWFASILRYTAFPGLLLAVVCSALWAYAPGREGALIPAIFLAVMLAAIALERAFPFEPRWVRPWSESRQDGLFFLLTQPVVALAEAAAGALGAAAAIHLSSSVPSPLWPTSTSPAIQIPLALLVSDLLPYLYHRASHESSGLLWRIHALHHAPARIYSVNFIRFHPANSFISTLLMLMPLVALGVPPVVLLVVAAVQKTHALLSHTNFDFRLGPLNWIFSMAELHRWHHARDIQHANANYGATLIVWDALLGTRKLPQADVREVPMGLIHPQSVPQGTCRQICLAFRRG